MPEFDILLMLDAYKYLKALTGHSAHSGDDGSYQ